MYSLCLFGSLYFINSLLTFPPCSSILLPSSLSMFMIITLNFYWVDCLSPLHLVLLLGFYLVLSFGISSSVTSFCLNCCFCVYVFFGLHFPILEKWSYVRSILWGPAEHSLLDTRAICSRGALCVNCLVPSVGSLLGIACPQPGCL